jgi:hypothetical protein
VYREENGICSHVDISAQCNDEEFCNGTESCNPAVGCVDGADPDCSNLTDSCNVGVCDEALNMCIRQPANQGGLCVDDGLFCSGIERQSVYASVEVQRGYQPVRCLPDQRAVQRRGSLHG